MNHKWHGDCEVLSVDGKYLTIRFLNGETIQVKRVQARMVVREDSVITPAKTNSYSLCLCRINRTEVKKYGKCLYCHIKGLRNWATEIKRLKNDVGTSLSETNKAKWDAMNSQQKKIAVFRAMELGFISWRVERKKNVQCTFLANEPACAEIISGKSN